MSNHNLRLALKELLTGLIFLLLAFWILFLLPWQLYLLYLLMRDAWRLGP